MGVLYQDGYTCLVAFFESDYPSVESFNVDWYSAKVVCYDDLEFFKKYQKDIKKHSLSD